MMSYKNTEIAEGTVSHGTLRSPDLIRAFFKELLRVTPATAAVRLNGTYGTEIREAMLGAEEMPDDQWASECVEMLIDSLNYNAPDGYYFGTLEGDASDFGWWREQEEWLQ